jgi:hypothetical protein
MFRCLPHPLVVIPCESGQHFFEDGVRRMGGSIRDGSAHLPLAVARKGRQAGDDQLHLGIADD